MNKRNIAILFGGKSGEHEVSLRSASSVEKHLDKNLYNINLIGITKNGLWYFQENYTNSEESLNIIKDENNLVSLIPGKGLYVNGNNLNIDFIFPILHGTFGEDGTLQGLLELMDIPYAGSGLDGSFMAMDKEYAKIIWERENIPVVPYLGVKKIDYIKSSSDIKDRAIKEFGFPLFIKPVQAGSSVGVSRVDVEKDLDNAIDKAFKFDEKILIEPAVDAREVECSVIGNSEPIAFSLGEISSSHEFYDYEAKYLDPNGAKLLIPAPVDNNQSEKIKKLAVKAYSALNIKGFARVDFFLDKKTSEIKINEINTIPGFTNVSMFAMMCAQDGLEYTELLNRIYEYGIERYKERKKLTFSLNG